MRLFDGGDVAPRRLSLIKTSGGAGGRVDMFDSGRGGALACNATAGLCYKEADFSKSF